MMQSALADLSDRELDEFYLPTQDDLPYDDGVPMETLRHKLQMDLLIDVLYGWLQAREDGFASGNMFLYYSLQQVRQRDFIGPDFFVTLGVPKGERKSWVIWEEGKGPDVIIELLSRTTIERDKTTKKQLYESVIRVPEYFWYDPFNPEDFEGFSLRDGRYHALKPNDHSRLFSQLLDLSLGGWRGEYRGVETQWLRWFTPEGELLPTEGEAARHEANTAKQDVEAAKRDAEAAKRDAETAKRDAETAKRDAEAAKRDADEARRNAKASEQRAEQLAAHLRTLGVEDI